MTLPVKAAKSFSPPASRSICLHLCMRLNIIPTDLLPAFCANSITNPVDLLNDLEKPPLAVDYFAFYKSVSSVYSSKIEGEDIDFDSYYKHKFLQVAFLPDYTRKPDDLYAAYDFIEQNELTLENVHHAHRILAANLLPVEQLGSYRTNPMFVINSRDQIEYVAADAAVVARDMEKLFMDVETLLGAELSQQAIFYFAAMIHLVFVKIHPFQDGNGRTARLLEKWFLLQKIGRQATAIELEKNYFNQRNAYYHHLRQLGLEYAQLDYQQSLPFASMTIHWLGAQSAIEP